MEKKSKNPMLSLIDNGLGSIGETTDTLARLWRLLLWENNTRATTWMTLMNKWLTKTEGILTDKAKSNLRGNLTGALASPKISWGTLIRGITILEYVKVDIEITAWKVNPLKHRRDNFPAHFKPHDEQDEEKLKEGLIPLRIKLRLDDLNNEEIN